MSAMKLTYFDITARGEPIRLALSIGGLPFDDVRVQFSNWAKLKPTTPYGSLPVAEIDGHTITQSFALFRYAGKKAGLYPKDDFQALLVDEIIGVANDFRDSLTVGMGGEREALKKARAEAMEVMFPRYIVKLEKRLKEQGNKSAWLVGDKVSMADIFVTCLINELKTGFFDYVPKDAFDQLEKLSASYEAVMKLDGAKKWYKAHPI